MNAERRRNSDERGTRSAERRISILQFSVLRSSFSVSDEGFSLIEVMVAMVILAFGLLGAMAMFQWADHSLHEGDKGIRAMALAQARVEAKCAAPWSRLLSDDLDGDGRSDFVMRDDGSEGDLIGGDGVFSASFEEGGIRVLWTVQPDRPGPLSQAGSVVIRASASFLLASGQRRELHVGTIRANPSYVGEG